MLLRKRTVVVQDDSSDYSDEEDEAVEEDEDEEEEDVVKEEEVDLRDGGEQDDAAGDGDDDEEGDQRSSVTKKARISISLKGAKVCKVRAFVVTFPLCAPWSIWQMSEDVLQKQMPYSFEAVFSTAIYFLALLWVGRCRVVPETVELLVRAAKCCMKHHDVQNSKLLRNSLLDWECGWRIALSILWTFSALSAKMVFEQVCKAKDHQAGFVGSVYMDCPNKPCYLCKKPGGCFLCIAPHSPVIP